MKSNKTIKLITFGITLLLFASCNTTKYVHEQEHLLTKNDIFVNNKKHNKYVIKDYIIQRPNRKVIGIPVGLNFYNLGSKDYIYDFDVWKDSFPQREKRFTAVFSEKQTRNFRYKKGNVNQWFFKKGDEPVILDTVKTTLSTKKLKKYFISEGYYRANISSENIYEKKQKARVVYTVDSDKVFTIDSINTKIEAPLLDSIYQKNISKSFIKKDDPFRQIAFEEEADRITSLYRNSGFYHFSKNSIRFEADTTQTPYEADIKLIIDKKVSEYNDDFLISDYKIQTINRVNIYTDYSYKKINQTPQLRDSLNGYYFYSHGKLKYNPKYLSRFAFIEPNTIYSDNNTNLTRRNYRRLKNFRSVNIKFKEIDSTTLEADILLTPLKKYSLSADTEVTHSNIKQLGLSGKVSLLSRNIFRDASNLQFSVQGAFFNSTDAAASAENEFFNAWEFGGDITLQVPRILSPIKIDRWITKQMLPQTQFTVGTSFQKNIGLDKQKFTGIMSYNWESSTKVSHRLDLFNSQFIKNLNIDAYFDIYISEYTSLVVVSESIDQTSPIPPQYYDENGKLKGEEFMYYVLDPSNGFDQSHPEEYQETQNIKKQYDIITENVVVPLISYEYIYNSRKTFKDPSYSYFRGRIASAGVIATQIAPQTDPITDKKTFFDIPIAQYVRLDLEYKKFWGNTLDNVLGFRTFFGIAVPYGNSTDMPFSRSYFIGGANDLRAWQVYELGPGGTKTGLEYNVGTLKILSSLEYRVKIISKLKGALFADAGNIWDITNSSIIEEQGKFKDLSSLEYTALGTGFGLRYDFSFLVIRIDTAFKTYEPYLNAGDRWFKNYNFGNAVYNFGINYPF